MLFILGLLDILVGFIFIFLRVGLGVQHFAMILAVYAVIKALIFIKSFSSVVDLVGGIVLFIFAAFGFTHFIAWIFAIWFLQKGFFSLVK